MCFELVQRGLSACCLLCYAKLPNDIAVIIGGINTAKRPFMAELSNLSELCCHSMHWDGSWSRVFLCMKA